MGDAVFCGVSITGMPPTDHSDMIQSHASLVSLEPLFHSDSRRSGDWSMDSKQAARNLLAALAGVAVVHGAVWLVGFVVFGRGPKWGEGYIYEYVVVLVASVFVGGTVTGALSRLSFDSAIRLFLILNVGLITAGAWMVVNHVDPRTMLVQAAALAGFAYFGQLLGLYLASRHARDRS
jgi:hypothetical protein